MKSQVVIFGTSYFAKLVHFYLTHDSEHEVVAFTVHAEHLSQKEFLGLPVVPFEEVEKKYPADAFKMFIAVAYKQVNRVRAGLYEEAKRKGYTLVTYVSSKCSHWGDTVIGDNCFIFEENTIQPFVTIGNNVVLWSGNHIGHDSTIGDHCFITSHVVVCGIVEVGSYTFLGVNSTIRDNIRIGKGCVIGAGALIMKRTKDYEVYLGERTKPFNKRSDEIKL